MVKGIGDISPVMPLGQSVSKPVAGFQQILKDAIQRVESSRVAADDAVKDFVTGKNEDLHSTVLATQRASLDFDFLLQVRNKVIQGYQEVMRMQL
jgi:flagellar hook-basal body complex protein FliE